MQKRKIDFLFIILWPLSILYRLIIVTRNLLFDWGILSSTEFKLPVISVGNITVGGTGKTPHVEYLIRILNKEFNVATLSRGYMRKSKYFTVATMDSSVGDIGDEARQIKQKFPEITVAVDRKRVNGIKQLKKLSNPIDVILLDDAYQHRYVKPGRSILLIDFNRMLENDYMLPAGRLREPASGKSRADIILITKSPERIKPIEMRNIATRMDLGLHQHLYFTSIAYDQMTPVFKSATPKSTEELKAMKVPVLLLSGIANPRPLRKFARSVSTVLHEITFPDHHAYIQKDIKKIELKLKEINHPDTIIITTEKDSMRLEELELHENLKNKLYYVSIVVKFLNDDQDEFNNLILNYVRSNKRDNILHKEQNKIKS